MATRSGGKYRAWIRPFRHWWKPLKWIWGALILGFVVNGGSSWLITKSFDVSGTPLGWVIGHPGITFPLVGALILLTCLAGLAYRQEDVLTIQAEQRLMLSPQRRLQLIRSFRQEYADRLTHSLQGSLALELELHNRTDVIISSASLVFRHQEAGEASPLLPGTSILQAYDRIQRGMLILGAPGSGKTTLLLTLARDLLHRAENELDQPLVIILNLSSWARTRLPLTQWLVQQCSLVYAIPKRHMAAWIEQEQVQFLLDGLDEMGTSARTACIETINSYRQGHLAPLVVCSRSEEYVSQPTRLLLPGSVEIQPLEPAQISQALKQAGTSLAVVREALRNNAVLRDLLTTPLMLSIVILTYRDKTAKELPQSGSPKEQQREIFEQYVQRMLQRYQQQRTFSLAQMSSSLVWLAQQMQQRDLTEFHLESLQADWMNTTRARDTYRLVAGLVAGLVGGLIAGLVVGLVGGLVAGLADGLFFGLVVAGIVVGDDHIDIEPVEKFIWSWEARGKGLGELGWPGGLLSGLFVGLYVGSNFGLVVGLLFGLVVGLLFGLVVGLSGTPLTKNVRLKPNQGIHTSGWNALRLGLVFFMGVVLVGGLLIVLGGGLFFGRVVGWVFGPPDARPVLGLVLGLVVGLLVGLFFGLVGGLFFGGAAYFKHYVLRLFLAHSRALPWRAVPFLEEAKECILLQRESGGYRFIHPLLQEYFASLTTYPTAP